MAKRLLLVRHGEPEAEYKGRFLGATDVALSEEGLRQAAGVARAVHDFRPGLCLCSPLQRARQTATAIIAETGLEIVIEPALREIDFGRWEGKTFGQIARDEPEAVDLWAQWSPGFSFPDGETLAGFQRRVEDLVGRLVDLPEETVLVVSHGGVIRAMICYLLGLAPRDYLLFEVGYATSAVLDIFAGGKGVLAGLNIGGLVRGRPSDITEDI